MDRMHSRYVNGLTIRPLRNGDTETVAALFERLGAAVAGAAVLRRRSRGCRTPSSRALARVDADHHVLVGYVDGDRRAGRDRAARRATATAEIAFEVADEYQGRGVGSVLARELAADARAAGITELVATVCGDNPRAVALLKPIAKSLRVTWRGREREFVVGLES